jgi:hypothetical protein
MSWEYWWFGCVTALLQNYGFSTLTLRMKALLAFTHKQGR